MERLRKNHTIQIVDEALRYHIIQLRAEPVTRHYAMALEQSRKDLDAAEKEFEKAHEERLAATKNVWLCDKALNRAVMTLALDALVLTQNNRKDRRFLALFPSAPSKITTPVAGDQKIDFVKTLMDKLSQTPSLAPLMRHVETMAEALKNLEEALVRRKELEAPEKRAMEKRDAVKTEAIKGYNMMQARLQILFDDDTARVNSFFADLGR